MCYLHFGNGVLYRRRNETDYRNGVCTFHGAIYYWEHFSSNWPLCSANTASEANVPSISRPAVNETILVHDFPHQAPRTSRPNDHPTPGKMPKKQTGHRKKSDTNGSSAHDEHKVKKAQFWPRAPLLRSLKKICLIDTNSIQDFLCKLGMKPSMHLVEISIFSLNHVIVRHTEIIKDLCKAST